MASVTRAKDGINIKCRNALEFLQVLSPIGGVFDDTCIYRGVSSSTHTMIPVAHRDGVILQVSEFRAATGPMKTIGRQCACEFYTVDKFFEIAARHGVRLPEDSLFLRTHLESWRAEFNKLSRTSTSDRSWPPRELFATIALAQHYGVPTRALDWTFSSYIAAYFAARTVSSPRTGALIAVWVVDDLSRRIEREIFPENDPPLVVYTVSAAENDNLRAQRGLFMIRPQSLSAPDAPFEAEPYDKLLLDSLEVRDDTYVVRVLVPQSEARNVLSLLSGGGVTAGALFPGLWGVAREYEEEQFVSPGTLRPIRSQTIQRIRERVEAISARGGA